MERSESRRTSLFKERAQRAEYFIYNRFNNQIKILRGAKGFVVATDSVTRKRWKTYCESLDLLQNFPGMQGIGYAPFLKPDEVDDFKLSFKNIFGNERSLYPEGERDFYTPILFLEPENSRNRKAVGFDMLSDPRRREAMMEAMETNSPNITSKVTLVQEHEDNPQAGFLLYLPVYKNNSNPASIEERRELIQGFVYNPFRMDDLINATLGDRYTDLHIVIYDGTQINQESLLYDNYQGEPARRSSDNLHLSKTIDILGHKWLLQISAMPGFGSADERYHPYVILIGGTVISLLFFFFMWAVASQRRANELRKVITDNATAALFMINTDGYCTFMNPAAEEMTGFSFEEIKQKPLHYMIHHTRPDGSTYPIEDCPINKALATNKEIRSHEDLFIKKDGSFYHVKCAIRPIFYNGGAVSAVVEARDITAEKIAQQQLKDAKNQLELSEAHYRSVAEGMPVLVWTASRDGEIEYCNQKWYDYTGYPNHFSSPLQARKSIFHPDEEQDDLEKWLKAIREGGIYENQHRIKRHDGQYRWHISRALPLKDNKGNVQKWFVTSTDIHEQVVQNNELIKINRDLDNFVYTASHDLKSPITNLEGIIYMLYSSLKDSIGPQETKFFDLVNLSIQKFKNTISDLSEITKIQKNANEDIELINIEEKVEDVKAQIQKMIEDSHANIETEFLVPHIKFSGKNLQSIIYNLLSNAIKYQHPSRKPYIKIRSYEEDGYVIMSFEDNGLGIDLRKSEKLFGMFKRLHDHVEGTGIGLYIVKRILENTEGKIEVESELGKGSTFKVYFKKEAILAAKAI